MKIYIKKAESSQIICTMLLCLFYLFYWLAFLGIVEITIASAIYIVIGLVALLYSYSHKNTNRMTRVIIFITLYTISFLISYFYNSNADLIEILWPLGFMGIGTLFINYKVSSNVTGFMFISYVVLITILIITRGGVDYIAGVSSRNTVSVNIVLYLAMHFISCYKNKKSISLYYSVLALIGCFLAIGRSGIVIAVLILLLFIGFEYNEGRSKIRSVKLFVGTVGVLFVFSFVVIKFFPSILNDAIYNFEWRGLRSLRFLIWSDYIEVCISSIFNFLFGGRIEGTSLLNFYNANLHNSFFMLHAKFGLFGLMMVVYLLIKTISRLIKNRNMYLLAPLILIIYRMNFDYTNFNGVLDIVLIYFLVYATTTDSDGEVKNDREISRVRV